MTSKSNPFFVERWSQEHFDPWKERHDKMEASKCATWKMWNEQAKRQAEARAKSIQIGIEHSAKMHRSKKPVTLPKVWKDE